MLTHEKIKSIITDLKLPEADLYIWADGSGCVINLPCAFACLAFSVSPYYMEWHVGCFTKGTNNYAELLPFSHALYYDVYVNKYNPGTKLKRSVELVTDSQITAKQGNREYTRNANRQLWAGMDYLESLGYTLHWNHVKRNTNEINAECDKLAGAARLLLTRQDSPAILKPDDK